MSLTDALSSALTGLNATQTSMSLVAGNVANANTPGYVRKTATLVSNSTGTSGAYVQVGSINRMLDQFVQTQVRTESAGAAYADMRSNMYSQLQSIYGTPNSASTIENAYNKFTSTLQALTTSPGDRPTQIAVVSAAQSLTQTLNQMTSGIQTLRSQAEQGLSDDVTQANNCLQQIATLNKQLAQSPRQDAATAGLLDQRDSSIDKLSKLMDIRVVKGDNNQVRVFTNSGVQLVGTEASTLSFDAHPTVTAQSQWSATASKRSLGTITLTAPGGGTQTDLVATGAIRSGEIAGYLDMRDHVLVQAQAQVDQFASAMSTAMSGTTTDGAAVTVGGGAGYAVDISGMNNGDTISLSYTDNTTNTQHRMIFKRVDPSALPLSGTSVVGLDFSGGYASVISQIQAALPSNVNATLSGTSTLQVVDDGAGNQTDVNALSTTVNTAALAGGSPALPFFLDGTSAYTGSYTSSGAESVGLAGRISVNTALVTDPSNLVNYTSGLAASDATRANYIYDRLMSASHDYNPSAGIGTTTLPYSGTLGSFVRQFISQQGEAANNASSLKQGQDVVLSSLQQRFNDTSGVNIDQEMSHLLSLQNAYAANARVMTTVKTMLDQLMQMGA